MDAVKLTPAQVEAIAARAVGRSMSSPCNDDRKALISHAGALEAECERLRGLVSAGRNLFWACNHAWSSGEPSHQVKKMLDAHGRFGKALAAIDGADAVERNIPALTDPVRP